ncbi:hypothetical protein ACLUEY_14990 [Vreelandella aquamarina]
MKSKEELLCANSNERFARRFRKTLVQENIGSGKHREAVFIEGGVGRFVLRVINWANTRWVAVPASQKG